MTELGMPDPHPRDLKPPDPEVIASAMDCSAHPARATPPDTED